MSFKLTELVIETILRDSLKAIKDSLGTSTDVIDDIFGAMTEGHLNRYYGQKELNTIKGVLRDDTIEIAQGYPLDDIKVPTIAINLAENSEDERYAAMDDFLVEEDVDIEPATLVEAFNATSYDSVTGLIDVNAADPDLSAIRVGHVFVDGDGNSYPIVGGIDNDDGSKHFFVDSGQDITNLTACTIKSSVDVSRRKRRAIRDQESITITIMTQNQLLTKYLYVIVKYIIAANKSTLIGRGIELSSYSGSDFNRQDRLPNNVFARFFTIRCSYIEHSWLAESLTVFGAADPAVKVLRDLYRREDEDDLTVETVEEDE